ncbi:hypothetical protein M408DRAFT_327043 [Serendipita vermifera MAFF 305830]|uniref:ubiquitinyl hydrolase 1 n=1 Tax=Serendipita vermifera MAFF 305830 TaxID=933852 RepID=A0A0C3B6N4_SERVB|nr:hypothetical protein M408DRAFT_327043 [Serendipita vermifera MAFF 305830]
MSLLRWMGVSQQASTQNRGTAQSTSGDKSLGTTAVSSADAKRFGLENAPYANSVLQALYFSEPFRELVVNSPDRANLYPPQPPLVVNPVQPTQPPPSNAKTSTKPDTKASTSGHKRPVSGGHPEPHSKADAEDTNAVNTGPTISAQPPTLFSALRSLFIHISQNSLDKGTVAPQVFIAKLRKENELFRTTMHQDAHEFLNYLVNTIVENIEEEEKLVRQKERLIKEEKSAQAPAEDLSTSIITTTSASQGVTTGSSYSKGTFIHSLFEGTLTSETRCLTCETVSSRDEMFLDLSIDIEQNSSVTACLRQFSASEMLCQRNKFFCDSCCGLQEAEKRMKIKRLPNILALHLKRFKYQEDLNKYVKLNYRVAFPFQLRLFNTVDDAADMDRLYELWAIVVHIGRYFEKEGHKEEKSSSGGWRSFRTKEKRRDSVSQTQPQAPASTAPSSPRTTATMMTAPPSPKASTVLRPSTASTNIMDQIPPLPAPALPVVNPSIVPAVPELPSKVANGDTVSPLQQLRRPSTAEPTLVDGSDSLSGSSSWTSAGVNGVNGVLDVRDIPPLPKDLPPVPPLPPHCTFFCRDIQWCPVHFDTRFITVHMVPLRPARQSTKDSKDAIKARKAAEAAAKKNKEKAEEERRKLEKALKEREKMERERAEREREKAEKEHHKLANRVSRKMSLGLSGLVGWSSKDKDRHHSAAIASSSTQGQTGSESGHHGSKSGHLDGHSSQPLVLKPEVPSALSFNF